MPTPPSWTEDEARRLASVGRAGCADCSGCADTGGGCDHPGLCCDCLDSRVDGSRVADSCCERCVF